MGRLEGLDCRRKTESIVKAVEAVEAAKADGDRVARDPSIDGDTLNVNILFAFVVQETSSLSGFPIDAQHKMIAQNEADQVGMKIHFELTPKMRHPDEFSGSPFTWSWFVVEK
jgi:hypothetical protein